MSVTDVDVDDRDLITRVRGTQIDIVRRFKVGESAVLVVEVQPHSVDALVRAKVKGGGFQVHTEQVLEIVGAQLLPDDDQAKKLRDQVRAAMDAAAGRLSLPFDDEAGPGTEVVADENGTILTPAERAAARGIQVETDANDELVAEAEAWLDEHGVDPASEAAVVAAADLADVHAVEALDAWEQADPDRCRQAVYDALDARKAKVADGVPLAPADDPTLRGLPVEQVRERLARIGEPGPLRTMLLKANAERPPRKKLVDALQARIREILDGGEEASEAPAGEAQP